MTWSIHTTDGFDTFSGAWDSFNLKKNNSWHEIVSVPVFSQDEAKGIRIGISPNSD